MSDEKSRDRTYTVIDAVTADGERRAAERASAAEIERLRTIEVAARRFVTEAASHPRYISVRTWATPDRDPYNNLKEVLARYQQSQDKP